MTEIWGAIVVVQTIDNQFAQLLLQNYPSKEAAGAAATAQALYLKNQFTTALGNILGSLFLSMDLNDGQPPVWLRVAQVVAVRPQIYQYT